MELPQLSFADLLRNCRKKVFITSAFGIVTSLLCLGLSYFPIISTTLRPVTGLIRGLSVIMVIYFWARSIDLTELLHTRGNAIIDEWEERLRPKSWKEQSSVQKVIYGLIAAHIIVSIFFNKNIAGWPVVLVSGLALFAFLFFILRWLKFQEAFMLQDIKHHLRNQPSGPS